MPGLVCAVSLDGPNTSLQRYGRATLAALSDDRAPFGGRIQTDSAILGAQGRGTSGVASHNDGLTLAVTGVIVSGVPGSDDPYTVAARLLAAYVEQGDAAFQELNGRFLITIWDETEKRLTVVTDRLGMQRAYIWRHGAEVVVSTKIDAISRHPEFNATLRDTGIAELIRCGFLFGPSTLFRDIDHLPYGSVVSIDSDGQRTRQYWNMNFDQSRYQGRSEADLTEELKQLLYTAVERTIKPGAVILLSSGYDSRALAMAAVRNVDPRSLRAFTLGPENSLDVIYARRIAEELAIPHKSSPIPEDFFVQYGKRGVELAEGSLVGHTCWRCAGEKYLRSIAPESIAHGLAGDTLQGHRLFDELVDETSIDKGWEAYAKIYPRPVLAQDEMSKLLKPELYEATRTHVMDSLKAHYDAAPGEHPLHKLENLILLTGDSRFYSMQSDYSDHVAPVHFPFTENALHEFMYALPPRMRHNALLYNQLIKAMNPSVAEIPMASTAMPIAAPPLVNLYYRLKGKLDYSIGSLLPGGGRNRGAYVRYVEWLRGANRPYIERLLSETDYLEDYFNIDHLRKVTADVLDGRSDDYGKIYNLASFVLFRKRFCTPRG